MRTADLRRQVSFEYQQKEQEAMYGTETVKWVRLCTCAAQVIDVVTSRSETVNQGLVVARDQTRITVRKRPRIDATLRVIVHGDGDKVYQIVSGPAEVGRWNEYLQMVCERTTA